MKWLSASVAYVYAHSREQFHPAAYALMLAAFILVAMAMSTFVLSLIFEALGSSGVSLDYETGAAIVGPIILAELVRGHVKLAWGLRPEQWCFPAVGIGGFSAGAVFGATMALKWGHSLWLQVFGWGLGFASLYLLVGWLIYLDEKKKLAAADTPSAS
jgi:hypothetical protein